MRIVALDEEDIQALSRYFESCPDQALVWTPLLDADPLLWLVVDRRLTAWKCTPDEMLILMKQANPALAENETLLAEVLTEMARAVQEHDRRHGRDQKVMQVREREKPCLPVAAAYMAYEEWAKRNRERILTQREFVTQMSEKFPRVKRRSGRYRDRWVFEGMELKKHNRHFLDLM